MSRVSQVLLHLTIIILHYSSLGKDDFQYTPEMLETLLKINDEMADEDWSDYV